MLSDSKEGSPCLENTCPDPETTTYCYCCHRKQKIEQDDWGNADPAPRQNLSSVSGGLLSGADTWLAEEHRELLPGPHLPAHKGRVIGLCGQTRAGKKVLGGGGHTRKNQLPTPLTSDEPYTAAIPPDCFAQSPPHQRQELPPSPCPCYSGHAAKPPQAWRDAAETRQDEQDPAPDLHALWGRWTWGTCAPWPPLPKP